MLSIGKTLLIPPGCEIAVKIARACFQVIPDLTEISVHTRIEFEAQDSVVHDCTVFSFSGSRELTPDLMADDKIAAAVGRFQTFGSTVTEAIANDYEIYDRPSALLFHPSGAMRLVRNKSVILNLSLEERLDLGRAGILRHFHPVFLTAPTGHEMMAWSKSFETEFSWYWLPPAG